LEIKLLTACSENERGAYFCNEASFSGAGLGSTFFLGGPILHLPGWFDIQRLPKASAVVKPLKNTA
jgi:hypothetical protein